MGGQSGQQQQTATASIYGGSVASGTQYQPSSEGGTAALQYSPRNKMERRQYQRKSGIDNWDHQQQQQHNQQQQQQGRKEMSSAQRLANEWAANCAHQGITVERVRRWNCRHQNHNNHQHQQSGRRRNHTADGQQGRGVSSSKFIFKTRQYLLPSTGFLHDNKYS
jgi:gas vesicle protein